MSYEKDNQRGCGALQRIVQGVCGTFPRHRRLFFLLEGLTMCIFHKKKYFLVIYESKILEPREGQDLAVVLQVARR